MRLTVSELDILALYARNPTAKRSIGEIAKALQKQYKVIHTNVKRLKEKNLIRWEELGGAKVCSLNFNEPTLPTYLGYAEELLAQKTILSTFPLLTSLIAEARVITPFFCLGVFGSHAKGSPQKGSDLDLFLVTENKYLKAFQGMMSSIPSLKDKIHYVRLSDSEFKDGLLEKGVNLYKEIMQNKIIFYGAALFYTIITEVYKT